MGGEPRYLNAVRVSADVAAVVLAVLSSLAVYAWLVSAGVIPDRSPPVVSHYLGLALAYATFHVLSSWRADLYPAPASVLNLLEMRGVLRAWFLASAFLLAAVFAFKLQTLFSRFVVFGSLALAGPSVLVARRFLAALLRSRRTGGGGGQPVVIVGCHETGRLLMKKILDAPHLGCEVVGFLDPDARLGTEISCVTDQATLSRATRRVIGRPDDLEAIAESSGVAQVLIVESGLTPQEIERVVAQAERLEIGVGIVPDFLDRLPVDYYLEDFSAIPVLRPHRRTPSLGYALFKRSMDLAGALVGLLLTAPLWALAALLVRIESAGPILFVQERAGLGGRTFRMFKFRTMLVSADPYAHSPAGDRDASITRVGRILRSVGIDELPQLLNVIRGEMSLVGPRPEMPFIVAGYTPLERLRLDVKPGITGLWQISPDRHAQIHDNIEYDLYYRNNHSLVLDALIVLETVFTTVEIAVSMLLRRRGRVDTGPTTEALTPLGNGRGDYVLVALDQRLSGRLPHAWHSGLSAAVSQAAPVPVKFLATAHNRRAAEDLISNASVGNGSRPRRVECVPVAGPRDIRALVHRAELVVTDLPNVALWALERGKKLVTVNGVREPEPQP